jgi:hypothetical protein
MQTCTFGCRIDSFTSSDDFLHIFASRPKDPTHDSELFVILNANQNLCFVLEIALSALANTFRRALSRALSNTLATSLKCLLRLPSLRIFIACATSLITAPTRTYIAAFPGAFSVITPVNALTCMTEDFAIRTLLSDIFRASSLAGRMTIVTIRSVRKGLANTSSASTALTSLPLALRSLIRDCVRTCQRSNLFLCNAPCTLGV